MLTDTFSWNNVAVSALFGFTGGFLGASKEIKELGSVITSLGLTIFKFSFGEILEYIKSKASSMKTGKYFYR